MRELVVRVAVHVNDVIDKVFNSHWQRRCTTVHQTYTQTLLSLSMRMEKFTVHQTGRCMPLSRINA